MFDLNARMLYKVKFSISSVVPGDDLLWTVIHHIMRWQVGKHNRNGANILPTLLPKWSALKYGNRIFSEDSTVFIESEVFHDDDSSTYWACRITESPAPARGYAPRQWITEIGFEQHAKSEAALSCVLTYSDRAGFVGPYQEDPQPSIPNLIKRYILGDRRLRVFSGADELSDKPVRLATGDWPGFEQRIRDSQRQLPYIYISPYSEEGLCRYYVDPQKLAVAMYGNAIVFYSDDLGFTSEMRYMSPEYSCYDGALRVYQPNTDEVQRHRYMSPNDLIILGEDVVIESLTRAFVQNVSFYDTFLRIEQCVKLRTEYLRRKRIEEIREQHRTEITEVESKKLDEAIEEEKKRIEAESLADERAETITKQEYKIQALQDQIDRLSKNASENAGLRSALSARESIGKMPSTREEVIDYFNKVFADRIAFSKQAIKSLKGCTLDPSVLWRFFFALATIMWDLYDGENGDIYAQFKNKTGFDCARGEGSATRNDKRLMRQYEITYEGEPIDIEPHLTFPAEKQSIHFGYSRILHRIIIGHCGQHLDNYTTRKVH